MRFHVQGAVGPAVRSVAFLAVTGIAIAALAASITDSSGGSTTTYHAVFTDVTGLNTGDTVRISGVRVGQVTGISVTGRRLARVTFTVREDIALPESVTASVKYLNLVGQRYVGLAQQPTDLYAPGRQPGQAASPDFGATLHPGSTIPVDHTEAALNLNALFNGFQPLIASLDPQDVNKLSESIVQVLQGEGGTVDQLIQTVGRLTTTLAGKDKVISSLIDNLNVVLGTINSRQGELVGLISTLRSLVSGLAQDRGQIGAAIQPIADLAGTTAGFLDDGRAPLKADIAGLGRLAQGLNDYQPLIVKFLNTAPGKLATIARVSSYGGWLNFYRCEVDVHGLTSADPSVPPPTGIPLTDARCKP